MKQIRNRCLDPWMLGALLVLAGVSGPWVVHAADATESGSPREMEIKAQFEYSFNDVSDRIVLVSGMQGVGSGFIANQDGKTYLFTNQHVLLGNNGISFRTATGRRLQPTGVELSMTRDVARMPLAEELESFEITGEAVTGTPVVVYGNSEGAGVARALYGEVIGVKRNILEVSTEFVSGNSGSPVLNPDQEVLGIVTFDRYFFNCLSERMRRIPCFRTRTARDPSASPQDDKQQTKAPATICSGGLDVASIGIQSITYTPLQCSAPGT